MPVSAIESLPTYAQEQIIAWLEVESRTKVVERLALPPPDGFDLRTHVTTLSRFYARYMARHHQDDLALAKILAPDASANPFETASNSLAAGWALQLGTKPRRNLSAFKAVSRWERGLPIPWFVFSLRKMVAKAWCLQCRDRCECSIPERFIK